jgi:dihydropteroate synthase
MQQEVPPRIMGILNITPDSFSDGGLYLSPGSAVERAAKMAEQGADIIDVGGESTRPGARPVSVQQQRERVLPVVKELCGQLPGHVRISIDTRSSEIAGEALALGADIINDVSAGRDDDNMFAVAVQSGAPLVLMHMQGRPETMQDNPGYENVVEEVYAFLLARALAAEEAGVSREQIVLDPGIGFGKRREDNLQLLAHLHRFVSSGYPVLLGTSRKRFMGSICNTGNPGELLAATVATTALGVLAGVSMFRVHDIEANRQAVDIAWAIRAMH